MAYKALTYVNLPPNNKKAPGDTITQKEFDDAVPKQGELEIQALLSQKAISKNMDAPIDKAHAPIEILPSANATLVYVVSGDVAEGSDANG